MKVKLLVDIYQEERKTPKPGSAEGLYRALQDLVCCPEFNGQVFERDKESHRAWSRARDELEQYESKTTG